MEIINLSTIAIILGMGMFIGAGIMFRIMNKAEERLTKELDVKSNELQRRDVMGATFRFDNMIEFAKFNTFHQTDCKTVYDKLHLYILTNKIN